jgi:hypothetical protein
MGSWSVPREKESGRRCRAAKKRKWRLWGTGWVIPRETFGPARGQGQETRAQQFTIPFSTGGTGPCHKNCGTGPVVHRLGASSRGIGSLGRGSEAPLHLVPSPFQDGADTICRFFWRPAPRSRQSHWRDGVPTAVRRAKARIFSRCDSCPDNWSLPPVAIGAAEEVTKPSKPSRQRPPWAVRRAGRPQRK